MALTEDAAAVLEQFIHDVANLPAEITHLMEEIQDKDTKINSHLSQVHKLDASLQKFIKQNGSLAKNPKEEVYNRQIIDGFDQMQALQDEKLDLAAKAEILFNRHVRRLDIKLRELQNEGLMAPDPQMPSLLRESSGNLVSTVGTGTNTPLGALSGNTAGGMPNIAQAAMARLTGQHPGRRDSTSTAGMQPHPLLASGNPPSMASLTMAQRQREMSASATGGEKRRKLNATLGTLPATSSNLARQSTPGAGTPKAGTPSSRAGSAGPSVRPQPKKGGAATRKVAPHQQHLSRKKVGRGGIPKKSARRLMGNNKASPSTTGDDESMLSSGEYSEEDREIRSHDGAGDDENGDLEEEDDQKYCICNSVSYGDMVACDNEDCPFKWFHWGCIGITKEPVGDWLCDHCKKLPPSQIRKSEG